MPKVALYDITGSQIGDVELSDDIFGVKVNTHVMYEAVKNYLANQRQGTQSAKTRGEVRGGGRKPWRQKGTGRARQGSIRAPQWIGGGVVFAPKPRDYSYKLPKKIKRLALKSALSSKVRDNEIIVVDSLVLDKPKTKDMVKILSNLKAGKKTLVVIPERDENVILASRNIPGVKTAYVNTINVYDILNCDSFLITKDAVNKVEEVYA
ncbi:MAG: 50S ribosomal protein L4 [Tissierellia bacterium]|jgi:large subunit ribosomal protein L4|nr:50S ribosomal protein L4 [Tissierellia bacterium]HOA20615.1 50S ribosomal protein L4 [Sedimentibacter sp.]HOG62758.1 50S ribosomal protein L4 [Sedimentibacter sp.]HOT21699.1 50S ribosomal protein L4 [Sedimentibacter sp.]HPY56569.1 50S ribosomal protein L4 [Sedimentibacter sp.]